MTNNIQIVVFKLGREEYGLSIAQIKEVVITPNITKMPRTPGYVKGVANVRGNIIAVLDLEEKFNIHKREEASTDDGHNFTLVIESEEYKTGVLVREVPNTLSIPSDTIEEGVFTGTESDSDQNYISGIVKLGKRLIIMIDIFKVINDQDTQQIFKKHAVPA